MMNSRTNDFKTDFKNDFKTTDELLILAKSAAKVLRSSSADKRNQTLRALSRKIAEQSNQILEANSIDLSSLPSDSPSAFRDRLSLNHARLTSMQESLKKVAELSDPIGEVVETRTLENGLLTRRVRSPLGVIFMIFESRPNVAIEAFSLALKSGNAIILRGGKESKNTTACFYSLMQEALEESGLPRNSIAGISDPDRNLVLKLLQAKKHIDVVVPRGGDALIEFVVENSKIPIIKNDRGLCHIYVHEDANLKQALAIVENAKVQRPGVCNSIETVLVHEKIATEFLPALFLRLGEGSNPVRLHACKASRAILGHHALVLDANEESFNTEYLDYDLNCKIVRSLNEAIDHIDEYGSKHSEAILTNDEGSAKRFQNEVDAAAVYWNASTRFTDGFELGLGGELGISTQKLHVRGPVGLRELTSIRWIMDGGCSESIQSKIRK